MASTHHTANAALKSRAAAHAEELVRKALPGLRSRYDKGHPDPEITIVLDGAVSQEILDLSDGDESFADYVGGLIFSDALERVESAFDGRHVDVYRDGHETISPGDPIRVTVKVYP